MKEKDEILLKKIGRQVLQIRIEKGLSQEDVAFRCEVDRGKISKIENGSANYQITTLVDLAHGLAVDVRKFFEF